MSGIIIYPILHFIYRNNRVSSTEAENSNPMRLFGMYVWPKREDGKIKIPKYVLIGLGIWCVISLFIEFHR